MAQSYYDITQKLKNNLLANSSVNTVTYGPFDGVDLSKQTIFPLTHFYVSSGSYTGGVWTYSIELAALDIVDISKDDVDNMDDVLNTQLAVITKLIEDLTGGDLYRDMIQISGTPTVDAVIHAYENGLSGWLLTLDIQIPNLDIGVC